MFNREMLYSHQEANQHKTFSNLYMPVGNSSQNPCAWTAPHYHQVLTFPQDTQKQHFQTMCQKYNKHRPNEVNLHTPEDP